MGNETAGRELLDRIRNHLGASLADVEVELREELDSKHPYLSDLLDHVAHFRGKRLRPILVLLSAEATGEVRPEHKVLAAVVEMIHTATLLHDDVLDDAETRRHVATVNARWNTETSVLFGDYLFTHAFHLASSVGSTLACRVIGHATNVVCEGELSQIHERGNYDLTEEQYLRIINGKTAELCACSCWLGARYAQEDERIAANLSEYGRSIGMAFQIADDLLDLVGAESSMGKTLGSDLAKQKMTLPLIRLMTESSTAQRTMLRELFANPDESARETLLGLLFESGVLASSRASAQEYADRARDQLTGLPDSPAKTILAELPDFSVARVI